MSIHCQRALLDEGLNDSGRAVTISEGSRPFGNENCMFDQVGELPKVAHQLVPSALKGLYPLRIVLEGDTWNTEIASF